MTIQQQQESAKQGFIQGLRANWPFIVILGLLCVLWLPHIFIINESVSFATAFEADPGGIIDGVFRHLSSYNMNDGYYSKYYGWTYFFIAFWLLKPAMLLLKVMQLYSESLLVCLIRALNFLICLASVIVLYLYLKRLFKNAYYASIGCLFFVVPAYLAQGGFSLSVTGGMQNYFYFIHPEPTGFLFLFMALWLLEVFKEDAGTEKAQRFFFAGVLFLALACFAKQPFFFVALPIYVLYVDQYAKTKGMTLGTFMRSRQFSILFLKTILFCGLLLYIVNPYALLEPKAFVKNQIRLVKAFGRGPMTLPLVQAWKEYLHVIGRSLFLSASMLIILTDIGILLLRSKKKQDHDVYFLVLFISSVLIFGIFMSNARYFISVNYLAPGIVFALVADLFLLAQLRQISSRWLRTTSRAAVAFVLAAAFLLGGQAVVRYGIARLRYTETNFFRVYEYIKSSIAKGARVAVSHMIAIPPENSLTVFQWWQNDTRKLADFNPDFLIYQTGFSINGVLANEAEAFNLYVAKNGYREIARFEDTSVFGRN